MRIANETPRPAPAGRWDPRDNRAAPPEPGYFAMRLVPRGPFVPCRIVHEHGLWHAIIDEDAKPATRDPDANEHLMRVWQHGRRITEADYAHALDVKRWARDNEPWHPCLHPHQPIALNSLPPVIP